MAKKPLPAHPHRRYGAVNACIHCGATADLHDEHIIPLALGGRWLLPEASCGACGKITSAFEGTCSRTILGPLRMLYGIKSRRKKQRPETLPLKVRRSPSEDWTTIEVEREHYPFLVALPQFTMPDELSGYTTRGRRDASAKTIWLCGAFGAYGHEPHIEALARRFAVSEIEPQGTCDIPPFCLMLAKIAHAYAVAELGANGFTPFLKSMIRDGDTSNRAQFIGGLLGAEPPSENLHELSFDSHTCDRPNTVSVRIRLLSFLGSPTYFVAAGRRLSTLLEPRRAE